MICQFKNIQFTTRYNLQEVIFVLLCCFLVFLCACQHFAIQVKKQTLEFTYHFQVDVSDISHLHI